MGKQVIYTVFRTLFLCLFGSIITDKVLIGYIFYVEKVGKNIIFIDKIGGHKMQI